MCRRWSGLSEDTLNDESVYLLVKINRSPYQSDKIAKKRVLIGLVFHAAALSVVRLFSYSGCCPRLGHVSKPTACGAPCTDLISPARAFPKDGFSRSEKRPKCTRSFSGFTWKPIFKLSLEILCGVLSAIAREQNRESLFYEPLILEGKKI